MHMRLEAKIVTGLDDVKALKPSWDDLLAQAVTPTVFSTWEWQYLCARHLTPADELAVMTISADDRLAAVLPLRRCRIKVAHFLPAAALSCLGGAITDYNPLIVREKQLSDVIPVIAAQLEDLRCPIDLANVHPKSPLAVLGRYLERHRFRRVIYESKLALVSSLDRGYDHFIEGMNKKLRRNIRQNQNYMDRTGGYTYHSEPAGSDLLDALVALHGSRWQFKGEGGALAHDAVRQVHTDLQAMPDKPFDIRYFTIRHDRRVVAILYGFLFRGRFYAYLAGLDMEHSRISPGNMVFHYCIEHLCSEGITVFDMLRGDMHYKQSWATDSFDMQDALYFPPTATGRGLYATARTMQSVKRIVPPGIKRPLKSLFTRGKS
jgi:CelD/BcsL family acetyltransferase involved in cellulose biosynthesis